MKTGGDFLDFSTLCTNCFRLKGKNTVCPYCGQIGAPKPEEAYHLNPCTILNARYIVGKVLGFGGFGVIYMALDLKLSRIVAIKEFFPTSLVSRVPGELKVSIFSGDKISEYNKGLNRFLEEARNMAKFDNDPHIVNVLEFFSENRTAYIVMEYLSGETLEQIARKNGGVLQYEDAVPIIKSVLEALSVLHANNIYHRDINPKNIMISGDNQIKLIDFGNARFFNESETACSKVVTGGYAPPEQYIEKSAQGAFTDIYAVGATFYKIIVGKTPLDATDRQNEDTLQKPSDFIENLPKNIDIAIMKAMALKPEQRFQTTAEMLSALCDKDSKNDYPENEEHARIIKRNALVISALAVMLTLVITVIFLTQQSDNLYKPMKSVIASQETVDLYLPYSSNAEKEELKSDYIKIAKDFNEYSKKNFGKDINIEPHYVEKELYCKKVSESKGSSSEACIFRSDIGEISNIIKADLNNLVNDKSFKNDFVFYSKYKEMFGSAYNEIPMGFYFYIMYIKNNNIFNIKSINSWADFSTNVDAADTIVLSREATPILYQSLKDDNANNDLASDILFRTMIDGSLPDIDSATSTFNGKFDTFIGTTKDVTSIKNSELLLYVSSRNVIGCGNKWYGRFDWTWSISDNVSDSKRDAAILFLRYCFSEDVQNELFVTTNETDFQPETVLSLNQTIWNNQVESTFINVIPEDIDDIIILSNDSKDLTFAEDFIKQGKKKNTKNEINTFAKKYF